MKMRMPGTIWNTEILRQLETTSQVPYSAPKLTRVAEDPIVAKVVISELVAE